RTARITDAGTRQRSRGRRAIGGTSVGCVGNALAQRGQRSVGARRGDHLRARVRCCVAGAACGMVAGRASRSSPPFGIAPIVRARSDPVAESFPDRNALAGDGFVCVEPRTSKSGLPTPSPPNPPLEGEG